MALDNIPMTRENFPNRSTICNPKVLFPEGFWQSWHSSQAHPPISDGKLEVGSRVTRAPSPPIFANVSKEVLLHLEKIYIDISDFGHAPQLQRTQRIVNLSPAMIFVLWFIQTLGKVQSKGSMCSPPTCLPRQTWDCRLPKTMANFGLGNERAERLYKISGYLYPPGSGIHPTHQPLSWSIEIRV